MKNRILLTLSLLVSSLILYAQDDQDVKQVVTSAYIEGIHNGGPVENICKGFHPSFNMLRFMDNQVKPLPIEEWITNLEKSRAEGKSPTTKTEGKFISVTVAGTSANVVLELNRDGK
jgi:hypothetical protein